MADKIVVLRETASLYPSRSGRQHWELPAPPAQISGCRQFIFFFFRLPKMNFIMARTPKKPTRCATPYGNSPETCNCFPRPDARGMLEASVGLSLEHLWALDTFLRVYSRGTAFEPMTSDRADGAKSTSITADPPPSICSPSRRRSTSLTQQAMAIFLCKRLGRQNGG